MSYIKHQRAAQPRAFSPSLHPILLSCHRFSTFFFYWHWIKSKNCSLWNEVGLVRTFRIQSQHSRDFQVSIMPKSPSILRNLERTDNLSVPRATLLHLSRIWEWHQGVGVDPDPQAVWSVWVKGMLPILLQEIPRPDRSKPAWQVGWSALPPHRPVDNKAGDSMLCETSISLLLNTKVIWKHQNQNPLKNLPPLFLTFLFPSLLLLS